LIDDIAIGAPLSRNLGSPTAPGEAWLLTRLAGWVSENPRHQGFAAKNLPELDGLASEATPVDA
jgi:hypothetical protein